MSNYKDWIDAIDLKVDYFSAFMKAWIAFNMKAGRFLSREEQTGTTLSI